MKRLITTFTSVKRYLAPARLKRYVTVGTGAITRIFSAIFDSTFN